MLELRSVSGGYGSVEVLHDVSLHVADGEIVALIGANGAGKSTLLRTIAGALKPFSGSIMVDGKSIEGLDAAQVVRRGVVLVPEGRRIFATLSVEENLKVGAHSRSYAARRRLGEGLEAVVELFPRLRERWHLLGGSLGGEQQMLAIGRAMMAQPRFLLLDEPSLGLAPQFVEAVFHLLDRINGQGTTVLLVEQNARMALALADRAYVLESGTVVAAGTSAELMEEPRVRQAYLGVARNTP